MLPPIASGSVFAADLAGGPNSGALNVALNVAALAILVGGFFVVGRYKSALSAMTTAAEAWKLERDAMFERSERLGSELGAARVAAETAKGHLDAAMLKITQLESAPDYAILVRKLDLVLESVKGA